MAALAANWLPVIPALDASCVPAIAAAAAS